MVGFSKLFSLKNGEAFLAIKIPLANVALFLLFHSILLLKFFISSPMTGLWTGGALEQSCMRCFMAW